MSVFETVKANVTVRQAAERYGLKATRSGMCCCVFHDDRHPSMKLNDRYYYCFGCHESGDVISLVSKLTGLTPYDAAIRLAEDFHLNSGDDARPVREIVTPVYCSCVLRAYKEQLKERMSELAPADEEDSLSDEFCEAVKECANVHILLEMLSSTDPDDEREAVAELMENNRLAEIEASVRRHRERKNERVRDHE